MSVEMAQIGITTKCNSHCYFCMKEEFKRDYNFTENIDLPIEGIKTIIDQGIKDIHLCGNRGESLFHPNINEIIDLIKSNGCKFEMNTNGGRFDTNWWYDLGQKMEEHDEVVFALDGLKDSHEYYRDTKWIQVYNNMKAFIKGGGNAIWQMIVFKHNENQINLVKDIAKSIGCRNTWIINSRNYNKKYQRPTRTYKKTKTDIFNTSTGNHNIKCKFFNGKRVYIDVHGKVWPCCYTKCHFGFDTSYNQNSSIRKLGKEEKYNIFNASLDEIVTNSNLFKRIFETMYLPFDNSKGNYIINYACHLHCNDSDEMGKNRRI